jgi:hypothetical protein
VKPKPNSFKVYRKAFLPITSLEHEIQKDICETRQVLALIM